MLVLILGIYAGLGQLHMRPFKTVQQDWVGPHEPKRTISCGQWARVVTDGIIVEDDFVFLVGEYVTPVAPL